MHLWGHHSYFHRASRNICHRANISAPCTFSQLTIKTFPWPGKWCTVDNWKFSSNIVYWSPPYGVPLMKNVHCYIKDEYSFFSSNQTKKNDKMCSRGSKWNDFRRWKPFSSSSYFALFRTNCPSVKRNGGLKKHNKMCFSYC